MRNKTLFKSFPHNPTLLLLFVLFLMTGMVTAQEKEKTATNQPTDSKNKPSVFAEDELAASDYLVSIERAGEMLDNAKSKGALDAGVLFLLGEMQQTEKALKLI
ncbi:MAG: hypothetical protein KAF41_04670, partial [Flavobacterium sp.]|nr:hypothetical protein [Flavobacterium sp.]